MSDVKEAKAEEAKAEEAQAEEAKAEETLTGAAEASAELAVAPEILADTLGQYLRGWWTKVKGGDSGVLPVVLGLVVIAVIFQTQNSNFLTAGNLTNLLVQGAVFMLLGMAEVFALLLGEIDLSIGFTAGVAGVVMAELLIAPRSWPWWSAILAALVISAAVGLLQGTIVTRLGLPSFVVTLAGLLGLQGLMLKIIGQGGLVPIPSNVVNDLANGNLTVGAGWVIAAAGVVVFGGYTWWRDVSRRKSGLVAPPASLTLLKIGAAAAATVGVMLIVNTNRGVLVPIQGMPWVVLIVMGTLVIWTVLLGRTRFGRYVYAVGGNAEAARRAGVSLGKIRTLAFVLCSTTAGVAGIIYASRLRSVSTNLDGGSLVLYAVAAAVIGGTSLFGGRGKPFHAVLGGLVIAAIANGMGLLGMSAAIQLIVTAGVLLAAVVIDAVARRNRAASGAR